MKGYYVQRPPSAFDKALCLDPGPLIGLIQASQPKEWAKFVGQHREAARDQFLKRVAAAVEADGTLAVLRLRERGFLGSESEVVGAEP